VLVLAIETSCDETSASVLRAAGAPAAKRSQEGGHVPEVLFVGPALVPGPTAPEVLSNIVLSQDEVHAPFGGVVPELASRQHIKTIAAIVGEALSRAGVGLEVINLYAVTQGPGLIGSLLVGLSFAKGLAYYHKKPLVGVDHLEAHLEACFLENPGIEYPVLGLLVSGGHTALYLMEEPLSYKLLGKTRDDAAGEALDKIAKFLGLGYPGGPVIEKLARGGDPKGFPFAVPRTKDRSLDFSFSGLKTAALKHIRERGVSKDDARLTDFLASFEQIVARALVDNLRLAADEVQPRSLVLCGGVARNTRLRARFQDFAQDAGLPAFVPSPKLCTDNAAMVGALTRPRTSTSTPTPELKSGTQYQFPN
jgi:N6-L-threonylcarbamoyladenine synthase